MLSLTIKAQSNQESRTDFLKSMSSSAKALPLKPSPRRLKRRNPRINLKRRMIVIRRTFLKTRLTFKLYNKSLKYSWTSLCLI